MANSFFIKSVWVFLFLYWIIFVAFFGFDNLIKQSMEWPQLFALWSILKGIIQPPQKKKEKEKIPLMKSQKLPHSNNLSLHSDSSPASPEACCLFHLCDDWGTSLKQHHSSLRQGGGGGGRGEVRRGGGVGNKVFIYLLRRKSVSAGRRQQSSIV